MQVKKGSNAADIILLLGRRHYTTGSPVIVTLAGSTRLPVRQAALDYLSRFGGDDQIAPLLVLLQASDTSEAARSLEKTLISMVGRTREKDRVAAQLAAVYPVANDQDLDGWWGVGAREERGGGT